VPNFFSCDLLEDTSYGGDMRRPQPSRRPYIKGIDGPDDLLTPPTRPIKGIDFDYWGLNGPPDHEAKADDEEHHGDEDS